MLSRSWLGTDIVIPMESRAIDDRAEMALLIRRASAHTVIYTFIYQWEAYGPG